MCRNGSASYLIALKDWLSMGDLMLLETMRLIETFEAIFALEL
jgi:hypothetical protein